MSEDNTMVGIPTLGLLPARNYNFTIDPEVHAVELPIRGKFSDLDPEFFKDNNTEFQLFDGSVFNVSSLTKLLFAAKKYPDLEGNQLFCPINFILQEDNILITGQVVTMLEAP